MLHAVRHPQLCQPAAHATGSSQHMLVHAECRPCSAACGPPHRQQRSRDVAASAKGRRAVTGDTLSEKLAELLPEHSNDAASQPQEQEPKRKRARPRKQQNEKAEEEEDVEIFSIDGGWAADAMDSAAELATLLGRGSVTDLDSAAASSRGGGEDAAASSLDEMEATWAAAAAEAEAMLDTARGGGEGEQAWASDDDAGEDEEETEWTTSNFEFDSDDEVEAEEETPSHGAAVPLAEVGSHPFEAGPCSMTRCLDHVVHATVPPLKTECRPLCVCRTTTAGQCQQCRTTTASSGHRRCCLFPLHPNFRNAMAAACLQQGHMQRPSHCRHCASSSLLAALQRHAEVHTVHCRLQGLTALRGWRQCVEHTCNPHHHTWRVKRSSSPLQGSAGMRELRVQA